MKNISCMLISLVFICSCGGEGGDITEKQKKIKEAPDSLSHYCDLKNSAGDKAIYANEVTYASCAGSTSELDLKLNNINFFKNIEILHLGSNSSYIGNIDVLPKLKKLKSLSITGAYESDPKMWQKLNLEQLGLYDSDVTSTIIPPVSYLKYLRNLHLGTNLNVGLSELSNLEELEVNSSTLDAALISNLENLNKLSLSNSNAHTAPSYLSFQGLLSDLPTVKEISMTNVSVTDFSFVGDFNSLKKFSYSYYFNEYDDNSQVKSLDTIECAENLTTLEIWDSGPKILPLDISCNNIINLSITSNGLNDISSLTNLNRIEVLNLSFNSISDYSPLYGLVTLKKLDITQNNINSVELVNLRKKLPNTIIVNVP